MARFERHNMCATCWKMKNGDRVPIQVLLPNVERCCFCGGIAGDGIYIRASADDAKYCMGHAVVEQP